MHNKVVFAAVKSDREVLKEIQHTDLTAYGFIPEFVGRLPVLVPMESLDHGTLVRILREPKNALTKQYERIFSLEDVKLSFTDESLDAVATRTLAQKTGARGLRSVLETVMIDLMFELPEKSPRISRIVLTEDFINGTGEAEIIERTSREVA